MEKFPKKSRINPNSINKVPLRPTNQEVKGVPKVTPLHMPAEFTRTLLQNVNDDIDEHCVRDLFFQFETGETRNLEVSWRGQLIGM